MICPCRCRHSFCGVFAMPCPLLPLALAITLSKLQEKIDVPILWLDGLRKSKPAGLELLEVLQDGIDGDVFHLEGGRQGILFSVELLEQLVVFGKRIIDTVLMSIGRNI